MKNRERQAAQRKIREGDPEAQAAQSKRRLRNRIFSQYGVTWQQYEQIEKAQGGLCAICGLSPIGRGKTNALVVDHCHQTNEFRGLLCGNCNIAIGLMKDDPAIAIRASEYLSLHQSRQASLA